MYKFSKDIFNNCSHCMIVLCITGFVLSPPPPPPPPPNTHTHFPLSPFPLFLAPLFPLTLSCLLALPPPVSFLFSLTNISSLVITYFKKTCVFCIHLQTVSVAVCLQWWQGLWQWWRFKRRSWQEEILRSADRWFYFLPFYNILILKHEGRSLGLC